MDRVVGVLRNAASEAFAEVATTWGDSSSNAAMRKAVLVELDRINRLDGELRLKVLQGEWAPSKWFNTAALVADALAYYVKESVAGAYSPGRFWNEVVVASAKDVAVYSAKAAANVQNNWPLYLGLAALVLVLLVVVQVAPAVAAVAAAR